MKRLWGCTIAVAFVLVAGVALAKPPVPISECGTVITEPGKYRVTQDLFCLPDQHGIQIFASDVTLDMKGHTITCDTSGDRVGAVLVGGYLEPDIVAKNVWVKNGTVSGCNDGVIFFYSQSGKATKITATGNIDSGIAVLDAKDTLIKNNVCFGNYGLAIASWGGVGSEIKHNVLYDNFDAAIALESGIDSLVACNTSERDVFGVRIGPDSSGNVVRGNYIVDGAWGIGLYGIGISPVQIFLPMTSGNLVKNNIVEGSGAVDLAEAMLNPFDGSVFALPECLNTWKKNQYGTAIGPFDCVAPPVELDDDDVCALDDDDDDRDDDDDDDDGDDD